MNKPPQLFECNTESFINPIRSLHKKLPDDTMVEVDSEGEDCKHKLLATAKKTVFVLHKDPHSALYGGGGFNRKKTAYAG